MVSVLDSAALARLAALSADSRPGVLRFDSDEPLSGRIAVLPSAFNPPTLAHLELLRVALEVPGVTAAAALLTTRNVSKGIYGAPLAHRVGMLLALPSPVPVLTTNVARFVEQALALCTAYPAAAFDFVAGYDTLIRIFDPHYYGDMAAELAPFFANHRLIATNREGATHEAIAMVLASPGARPFAASIVVAELSPESALLSSTAAREAAAAGAHPAEVPPSVARYIREHGLYVAEAQRSPQHGPDRR